MVRGRGETQRHSEGQRSVDSKPREKTQRRRHGVKEVARDGDVETGKTQDVERQRPTGQREGENVGTQRRLGTETERCIDAMRHVERDRLREATTQGTSR